jgi:hypothetical protein
MTPTSLTPRLLRRLAGVAAPSLLLTACSVAVYPSLGINGFEAANAPYVTSRFLSMQHEMHLLGRESWSHAMNAVYAGEQPECGSSSYDGAPGEMASGATVVTELLDCETGEPVETFEIAFGTASDGSEPSATRFTARVDYEGVRADRLTVKGVFILAFASEGSTGALAGDHTAATWQMSHVARDGTFSLNPGGGRIGALFHEFDFQLAEVRKPGVQLDTTRADFVFLDGAYASRLEVQTVAPFVQAVGEVATFPHSGEVRFRDQVSVEIAVRASDSETAVITIDETLGDSENDGEITVPWSDLHAAAFPAGSGKAVAEPGWL